MANQHRHEKHEEIDPDSHEGHGTRAVIASVVVNVLAGAAKIGGFVVTGSVSLLAEAIHSVADVGNQVLLLLGGRRAKRAANEGHPLGYGRDRYFWSFIVALALFLVGGMFAIGNGIRELDDPDVIDQPEVALAILGVALVLKVINVWITVRSIDRAKGDAGTRQFLRHAKSPELPVVRVEDVAAVVGLVLAIGGVTAAEVTDEPRWDAYGSIAVGAVMVLVALVLVIQMKRLLIGESVSRKDIEAIKGAIAIDPDVVRLIHLRAEHLGPDEVLVAAKVEFLADLTVSEVAATVDRVARSIRAGVPSARAIYLEPDVDDDARAGAFVEEHEGHIDPDDPAYEDITGLHTDDEGAELWSEE